MPCIDAEVKRTERVRAIVSRVNNVQANVAVSDKVLCSVQRTDRIGVLVDRVCRIGKYLMVRPQTMWISNTADSEVIANVNWNIN